MADDKTKDSLPRRDYWLILAVAVAAFLVADGPIWERPFRIDGPILWSYALIPVLVLAVLAYRKRLALKSFLLDTSELLLVKYAITATIAAVIWSVVPAPTLPDARESYRAGERVATKLADYTVVDPARSASITGVVKDASGAPVEGALVYVTAGLEAMRFHAEPKRVVLENGGDGFAPSLAVVEVGQELELRSSDQTLHTAAAFDERGVFMANFPMLGHGKHTLLVERPLGLVEVRCTVHRGEPRQGHLAMLAHPFHAVTDKDGRFELNGLPAAGETSPPALGVGAFHPSLGSAPAQRVTPEVGKAASLSFTFRAPTAS